MGLFLKLLAAEGHPVKRRTIRNIINSIRNPGLGLALAIERITEGEISHLTLVTWPLRPGYEKKRKLL